MDEAARPVIIAASALLLAGLVTLGVKAGGSDGTDGVNGDGTVAGATDTPTTAAPDTTPDPAPEPTTAPDPAPDPTTEPGTNDGSTTGALPGESDLDDMPDTGGGLAVALGGMVAAGSAASLRRRR